MKRLALIALATLAPLAVTGCGDDSVPRRDAAATFVTPGIDGGAGSPGVDGSSRTDGPGGTGGVRQDGSATDGALAACPTISFIRPLDMTLLTPKDDAVADNCAAGFQYDVSVSTGAKDGETFKLFEGSQEVGSAVAMGAQVTFRNAQLSSQGTNKLTVQWNGRTDCQASLMVTVDCNVPTCTITKPAIDQATHPALNNIPVANGGDRFSSPGADYQVVFEVTTTVEDGRPVKLDIVNAADAAAVTSITGKAMGGKATFQGVTLRPDGTYKATATCTNTAGIAGVSANTTYLVDTVAPDLTISSPADGRHFNPADLTNGAFSVCVQTTATDAVGLPASLGNGGKNLSAAIGNASPLNPGPVAAVNTDACVSVPCPTGSAPFDVTVQLTDLAGNPTVKKISGVSCSSTLPSVQIISPVGDMAPFSDVSKRLLAAGSTNAFKDLDPNTPGAQANVVACTDRATQNATLYVGQAGGALTALGAPVTLNAAAPTDNCPNGLGFVAKFNNVTLPESAETDAGALVTATELRVDVTDVSLSVGSSPLTDIWVDSIGPALQPLTPSNLCGVLFQSTTDVTTEVRFLSSVSDTTLRVTNGATDTYTNPASLGSNAFSFPAVVFRVGDNAVSALAAELSGNSSVLPSPCTVRVGTPPVVTWTSPVNGAKLCAATTGGGCLQDADAVTPGWQGALSATVAIAGVPVTTGTVTFTANPGALALGTAPIGAGGVATLAGPITLPEGAVQITATTSAFDTGVGSATSAVTVDTIPPSAATGITASTINHRQTTLGVSWTSPGDAAGYEVRVSTQPLTDANFAAAEAVSYAGTPAVAGGKDSVSVKDRLVETSYYFGVVAVDSVGNRSALATSAAPYVEHLNTTLLPNPTPGLGFGFIVDGAADLGSPINPSVPDGKSDLLVGEQLGFHAYLYYGASPYAAPATPDVTITGSPNSFFGQRVAYIGDIDGDQLEDVAVTSLEANGIVYIYSRRKLLANGTNVFAKGNALTIADAAYQVQADASYSGSGFGASLVKLGDFNGDNVDDFAVTAPLYNSQAGRVLIVLGKLPTEANFPTTLTTTDTTHTIFIDGPIAGERFGTSAVGLGRFYSGGGNTLAVSSRFFKPAPNGDPTRRLGRVLIYRGRGATNPNGSIVGADAELDGSIPNASIGTVLANLGPVSGGLPALGVGSPFDLSIPGSGGTVGVYTGTDAAGPFAGTSWKFKDPAASGGLDGFGALVGGGSFSGSNTVVSLIRDSKPDLVFGSQIQSGANPDRIYIIDSNKLASLTTPVDVAAAADVTFALPADWASTAFDSRVIKDIDGDGYADIALGETPPTTGASSRVAVIW